jgi:hypothetical protein
VRFLVDEAFRAALLRFRVVAAFFPAATRLGDFLVVLRAAVRLRVVDALRAAVRLRVVDALRPAVFRFRDAAAFFPAATRLGDFRVVFGAAVRFRVVAAFRAEAVRFRVVAGSGVAVVVLARVVAGRVIASSIGPAIPPGMPSDRGLGRSHAGVSGRHEGSGAIGASTEPPSSTSFASSVLSDEGSSSQGRSRVVRSSDDGMTTSSARRSPVPYPNRTRMMHPEDVPRQKGFDAVKSSHPRSDRCWYSRQLAITSSRTRITATP